MNVGALRHLVTLEDPLDGSPVVFVPRDVYAAIAPAPPGSFDEEKVTHIVTVWYHPQITFNTRITHRGRYLYVRGIQNIDEQDKELVLLCEEVKTP